MVPGHAGASQGVDAGLCRLEVVRAECRAELGGSEVTVRGQVQVAGPRGLPAKRFLGCLVAAQHLRSGVWKMPLEGVADFQDLAARLPQRFEVGEKTGPSADGGRPARAAIGSRPGSLP